MWITGYNRNEFYSCRNNHSKAQLYPGAYQIYMFNRPICPNDPNHSWIKRRGGHQTTAITLLPTNVSFLPHIK